jgi:hypothetical protein
MLLNPIVALVAVVVVVGPNPRRLLLLPPVARLRRRLPVVAGLGYRSAASRSSSRLTR